MEKERGKCSTWNFFSDRRMSGSPYEYPRNTTSSWSAEARRLRGRPGRRPDGLLHLFSRSTRTPSGSCRATGDRRARQGAPRPGDRRPRRRDGRNIDATGIQFRQLNTSKGRPCAPPGPGRQAGVPPPAEEGAGGHVRLDVKQAIADGVVRKGCRRASTRTSASGTGGRR